jgi:mRNA-degrading endonuclease RelE of RelBE toxin-antitoxin system
MDDEELFGLLEWLSDHPGFGKVIPASGGLRKVRWAAKGHGKRGGARIIYYWWTSDNRILLLDIYAKSEQEKLGAVEIDKLRRKILL